MEPKGTPVEEPELKALLRPTERVARDELLLDGDLVYYVAYLQSDAPVHFREQYVVALEDRGFSIRPEGNSPHAPIQRRIGFTVVVVQEAALEPYTIRYKKAKDLEEPRQGLRSLLRGMYPEAVTVRGRRLVFRFGSDLLKPWATRVLVPTQHLAVLPFDLPLPPSAVVRKVDGGHQGGRIDISMIAKIPPTEVLNFYERTLAGWGTPSRLAAPQQLSVAFGVHPPPWAPAGTRSFRIEAEDSLFMGDEVGVWDARHARFKPPAEFDNGQYQPKTLRHVPEDAYFYWVTLYPRR